MPGNFEMCLLGRVEVKLNSFATSISLQSVTFGLWHIAAFMLKYVNIVVSMLSYVMNRHGVGKDVNRRGVGNLTISQTISC